MSQAGAHVADAGEHGGKVGFQVVQPFQRHKEHPRQYQQHIDEEKRRYLGETVFLHALALKAHHLHLARLKRAAHLTTAQLAQDSHPYHLDAACRGARARANEHQQSFLEEQNSKESCYRQ